MITSRSFRPRRRTAGVALVLVLSILILLTAIVVAFFTNATTDLVASKSYSDTVKVKLLANSAVNLVEGQIRAATQGGDPSKPLAWASQPGLIRTYDTEGRQGTVYKLYSSDVLQGDGTFNPNTALTHEVPDTTYKWYEHPSDFVDLNSPSVIKDSDGSITDPQHPGVQYSARFPIIDGTSLVQLGASTFVYDGIVPAKGGNLGTKDGVPDIEGFSVQTPVSYDPSRLLAPNNNPVPMPVRWLYVLQDGQLEARAPADADQTGGAADAPGTIHDATAKNPVVGRIAFWTDDDTCKLNINAASEGTPWDRPRAKSITEVAYSENIPAQNEFQMFPGHPAKNCLSTVFGAIWPVPDWLTLGNYSQLKPYYDLAPRLSEGQTSGSAGGTQRTSSVASKNGVIYDADRLYTSVDELMFQPKMANDNVTRLARNEIANTAGAPQPITPQFLETSRFFLTASNRAPEVTLFNTPRLSLWPLQANAANARTSKEKLLAFCSTVPTGSNKLYSFQRLSAYSEGYASGDSPTLDFDPKYPSGQRNNELYGYLQTLVQAKVPGLGGNFSAKYGGSTNQILTEMVDLLRSGVNTTINVQPAYSYTTEGQTMPLQPPDGTHGAGTSGFGRFCTVTEAAINFFRCNDTKDSSGIVTHAPIQVGAMLVLQNFCPSPGFPSLRPDMRIEVLGLDQFTIQPAAGATGDAQSLGMVSPATNIVSTIVGYRAYGNNTEYVGMDTSFYTGGNALKKFMISSADHTTATDAVYPFINQPAIGKTTVGVGNLPEKTTSFNFNPGGEKLITINIYTNPNPPNNNLKSVLVQSIQMKVPPCLNLPVPTFNVNPPNIDAGCITPAEGDTNPAGTILTARIGRQTDSQTKQGSNPYNVHNFFGRNDVVRSVVVDAINGPSKGDLRVIAGLKNVTSDYFTTHPQWKYDDRNSGTISPLLDPGSNKDYNWRFAHSLKTGDNPGWGTVGWYDYAGAIGGRYLTPGASGITRKSAFTGSLVEGLQTLSISPTKAPAYLPEAFPAVPVNLTGAKLIGSDGKPYDGDWDTGQGGLEDGPYINKPDETNSVLADNTYSVYYSRSPAGNEEGKTYSPNRQVNSAVLFGSLSTGIDPLGTAIKPWQTLLFCPYPSAGSGFAHPGFGRSVVPSSSRATPPAPPYSMIPDHYILDLFTMPIVEPYALSEPLSTQGKVNMNYQIAPFTYIKRETAVRAVMKSVSLMAIPSTRNTLTLAADGTVTGGYKSTTGSGYQFRYAINTEDGKTNTSSGANGSNYVLDGTLKAFEDRFDSGDIFRSASEICSVPLVPKQFPTGSGKSKPYDPAPPVNPSYSTMQTFWDTCKLTGDNVREQPYGDLYSRLTTKSNTFTVHVRVQTLKKVPLTAANTFVDPTEPVSGPKDIVTAEYRGSYQIERYVDPNVGASGNTGSPTDFPDYATAGLSAKSLGDFYKFHTIGKKQF